MTGPRDANAFPFLRVGGPPREVGWQHGRGLADRIDVSVAHYRGRFAAESKLDWPTVLRMASRVGEQIRDYAPDLMQEMDGIAEGSGHSIDVIVALNARTGLLRATPDGRSGAAGDAECTTAACLPGATADGSTILAGNWDQDLTCLSNTAVLEIRIPDQPAVLCLTEAGILMRTGLNSAGLAITGNSLSCDGDDGAAPGIPWPVVRRRVLQRKRLSDAVKEVEAPPRAHSGNHLIASAEGLAVDLETTPSEVFALSPIEDIVVHSNHFVAAGARARVVDQLIGRAPSSPRRRERVDQALRAQSGAIDRDIIKSALQDHQGYPDSVCNHPDLGAKRKKGTVASHISDVNAGTLAISAGPPCENPYRTYRLA